MFVTSYSEALEYLYRRLPMFQRVGASAYKADLSNTIALCNAISNPQNSFRSIHIAGTNGKGSTAHMLASILQSAGYKTGLYTSPHLKEFTERIRINGAEVSRDFVVDFVNRLHSTIESIKPSFFEMTVAMAFDFFAKEKVDIAVIEVGLGGRLDSTNIITPVLSVITNIGWDHSDLLGDTLEKIAAEKAGIIKPSVPVVISERQPGIDSVFIATAAGVSSPITFASDMFVAKRTESPGGVVFDVWKNGAKVLEHVRVPLQGGYQEKNICGVVCSVEILNHHGFRVADEHVVHGLEHVILQTNLKGRWQKLGDRPTVICDTGHNADGVRAVLAQLTQMKFRNLFIIWGMVRDKDISGILALLPKSASYYFCQANIPRALEASALAAKAAEFGLTGQVVPDVNRALEAARRNAAPEDLIFIGGSTFVVADIHNL